MNLREERGAFWWHDEPIPQGQPAPESAVAGQLFVDDEGRSRLELDGNLPRGTKNSPKAVGFDPIPEGTAIRGVIKGKNQHVLLATLHRTGFNFSFMSHETFRAENCIIGDKQFPGGDVLSQLRSLEIDLTGFEAWLGLRSIAFTSKRGSITVKYKKPKDSVYPLDDGKLSIRYYVNRPFSGKIKTNALTLNERATLHYGFSARRKLEDATAQYRLLEEWLILMTNSEHGLDWPEITIRNKDFRYKLYFWRRRNSAPAPEMFECYPTLALVREQLGQLFAAWKEKRDSDGYASAFALYVASRRGFQLYTENRFTNFAVALESYHRTKYPSATQPSKLDEKVQRILGQIAKAKDKKWLEDRLQHAEIGLNQRITQVITGLPLDLEKGRCEQFGDECGRRRNELSHYGGRRDNSSTYEEFHLGLAQKNDALSYLLHVLILQELGVAADILHRFVYQSQMSIKIKHAFVDVGLLDKSVLAPSPAEVEAAKAGFLALQKRRALALKADDDPKPKR